MSKNIIRIATRKSPLALWQAEHVASRLVEIFPNLNIELVKMTTRGDKILDAPLAKVGGKGLFVKELEQGMLDGNADIAVHSMKDVPVEFPEGLHLAAILAREDPRDALVSNHYSSLAELPENARIGTSSLRRQSQIKEKFPSAEIIPLRGNVNTRLSKLDANEYDAIILAVAGLKRLGFDDLIRQALQPEQSLPAIGQGAIGIECRANDQRINKIIQVLHDEQTSICVSAERAMNETLHGGCQVPIAGFAQIDQGCLTLRGLVGKPDGSIIYRTRKQGSIDQAAEIGKEAAEDLLNQGADEILSELYN